MTKHNLSKSLAWLLQQSVSAPQTDLDYLTIQRATHSASNSTHPDNDEASASQSTMARLQLAPQSVTKPQLLAHPKPSPARIPTYLPQESPLVPSTAASRTRKHDVHPATGSTKTTVAKYDDSIFDIDDFDALLDEAQDLTASSYGDFGTPRRLWTENAASRVEPASVKQGQKRKSEEFLEDILASSPGKQDTSQYKERKRSSSYSRIQGGDLLHGDDTSAGIRYPQPKRKALTASQALRVSLDDGSPSKSQSHIRRQPQAQAIQPNSKALDKDVQTSQKTIIAASPDQNALVKSKSRHLRRAIVPDSDEENEEDRIFDQFHSSQLDIQPHNKSPRIPYQKTPLKIEESPPSQKLNQDKSSPIQQIPYNRKIEALKASSLSDSASTSSQLTHSPASSNSRLSKSQRDLVDRFMETAQIHHDNLLLGLDRQRKETSKQMAEQLYDHDAVSEELQAVMQSVRSRINALQEIAKLKDAYQKLCKRRNSLKLELIELIDEGSDFEQTHTHLKQIKSEVDELEANLHSLIVQLDWSENRNEIERLTPAWQSGDDSLNSGQRKVLVASTQHSRPQQAGSLAGMYENGIPTLTQPIVQTPISSRLMASHCNEHHKDQGYTQNRPMNVLLQSPRDNDGSQTSDEINGAVSRATDFYPSFTRNMGSPVQASALNDDFDHEFNDDDVEMLDAAQAFEATLHHNKGSEYSTHAPRPPLASVSGNTRRDPFKPENPTTSITSKQYPWTKDVNTALRKRFHLQGFRHNQLEAINATLGGKDAFVLMPTGGGKSLCYQLPSIIQTGKTRGVTVVISPLLSLMQDQVDHLQKLQIQAHMINGESTKENKQYIFQALKDHQPEKFIQLLYITPEMVGKSKAMIDSLMAAHRCQKLARIVIDEAHCVSQWGHDFRPDYKALGDVRQQFRGVPVMALTATATENVKVDVIHNLCMDGCEVFHQSFNRPNLSYEVREKTKGPKILESIADTINTFHRGQSGIVYCLSRKNCEDVAKQLRNEFSVKAAHYHAGMEPEERINIQKKWQAGKHDVIVATIAFGMGIDKPDVRFVIHYTIPKTLEGYYQETGRAGRDGLPSQCYLYYGYGDTTLLRRMIKSNKDANWQQQERQLQMLRNVVQYCENKSDCRRVQVLAYFNEHFDREKCLNTCDNCKSDSTFEVVDFSQHAKNAISLVRQLQNLPVTLLHCVDIYRGASTKKITDAGHKQLDEYGMGSDLERGDVERFFYRLVTEEALEEWNKVNGAGFASQYVIVGPAARDFETGKVKLQIQVRASPRAKNKVKLLEKGGRKKANGTGVRAADEYPASTNVSSPLESRKPRQKPQPRNQLPIFEEESDDDEYFEEDLTSFAPVRRAGDPPRVRQQQLGPPISSDGTVSQLNTVQRNVLEDFIREGKRYFGSVIFNKGLKQNPMPDSVLREIGIALPRTLGNLAQIRGMTQEKKRLYGPKILELVRTADETYQLLMQENATNPAKQKSDVVLEITDDEDSADTGENFLDDDDFDVEELDASESSHYFSGFDTAPTTQASGTRSRVPLSGSKSRNSRKSGSQSQSLPQTRISNTYKNQRGQNYKKRGSSGSKTANAPRGAKRNRSSGARSSGGTSRNNNTAPKSRGSAASSLRGGGLIGMMPT